MSFAKLFLLQISVFLLCVKGKDSAGLHCTIPEESAFPCDNGGCTLNRYWCDGGADCSDGSDEKHCPRSFQACSTDKFKCKTNNMCIPKKGYCDGLISCPDGSDERNCPCEDREQAKGSISRRIQVGKHRSYHQCWNFVLEENEQLTVTVDENFVQKDCKYGNLTFYIEGGYFLVGKEETDAYVHTICPSSQRYTSTHTFIFMNNVKIRYLSYFPNDDTWTDVFNITYSKINIDCLDPKTFKCSEISCVTPEKHCDGIKDCENGLDEQNCVCTPLELRNGSVERQIQIGRHRAIFQCWNFVLDENEQLTINVDGTLYLRECKFGNVTLSINGSYFFVGEKRIDASIHTICPVDMKKTTFTFINDVKIHFTSYFPFDGEGLDVFKITYSKINRDCLRPDMLMCSEISCVSLEKQCDGVKDCENGFDEENCGFVALSGEFFENSRKNATRWMRSQRDADWGWKENTARAVIALYLSNDLNINSSSHEDDLVAKQLELEVSTFLLRNKIEKASISEMSTYINALLAICHNPRNFYSFDLVKNLKQEIEASPNTVTPFPYLTLCSAQEIVSEEVIDSLVQILDKPADFGFALEIQALASMALSCISSNADYKHLKQNLTDHLNKIKEEQKEDGSFGNEYTTALVIQALIANNQANDRDWEFKAAAEYLQKMQKFDGSFGDFLTTYLIMPALNGRSLVDLGRVNCTESQKRPREGNHVSDIKNRLGGKIPVKYSLVIGDEKDQILPIFLRTPENITVLELMTLAADIDPKYKFKTHQMKGKTYVYEISSIPNDPEKNKFWFLYQQAGNNTEPTSKQSPDEVYVGENYHIIMWYRTLIQWHNQDKVSAGDIRQSPTIPNRAVVISNNGGNIVSDDGGVVVSNDGGVVVSSDDGLVDSNELMDF